MKGLLDLPTEVQTMIIDYLDLKYEFLSYRSTCAQLAIQTREPFIHRFFTIATHMWCRSSLQQLVDVAEQVDLGPRVSTLNLSLCNISDLSSRKWQGTRARRAVYDQFTRDNGVDEDAQRVCQALIHRALVALPKLRTLQINTAISLWADRDGPTCIQNAAERRLFYTSLATLEPLYHHQISRTDRANIRTQLLARVIQTIADSKIEITALRIGYCRPFAHSTPSVQNLVGSQWQMTEATLPECCGMPLALFPALLRRLKDTGTVPVISITELSVCVLISPSDDPPDAPFIEFIELFPQVEDLRLRIQSPPDTDYSVDPLFAPLCELLQKTTRLKGLDIWCSGDASSSSVSHFFQCALRSLSQVSLGGVYLLDGTWDHLLSSLTGRQGQERMQIDLHMVEEGPAGTRITRGSFLCGEEPITRGSN